MRTRNLARTLRPVARLLRGFVSRAVPTADEDSIALSDLDGHLYRIAECFDVESLLNSQRGEAEVKAYYRRSALGYDLFHSADGVVHMALNPDGRFDATGFGEQARFVGAFGRARSYSSVLELGCGPGYNVRLLAKMYPEMTISGIDLTASHLEVAARDSRQLKNASFLHGSFQAIPASDRSFDLVFAVESICHATDMELALSEAFRVLRPGGCLVVFDGFRGEPHDGVGDSFAESVAMAGQLVEASMTVQEGWQHARWLELAHDVGFVERESKDLSNEIMPSLLRLHRIARVFFSSKWLCRTVKVMLPGYLVQNAIAGLLMPYTVKAGAQRYFRTVLERVHD